ncbi:MAG: helix-turn-helix domain-containing protein [Eggerthellaceae bacterium]|nr:helix-turn-helix domain-containing protein [Eggerthellaceae bacterium]
MAMRMSLSEFVGEEYVDAVLSPEVIEFSMNLHLQSEIYGRMKELGVTQKELAKKMGVSPAAVSKMLSKDSNMRISTIARIASALECDVMPIKLMPREEVIERCESVPLDDANEESTNERSSDLASSSLSRQIASAS